MNGIMPEGGDAGGREREEEEHGRRKPLRAFLFSLADRTTNTDVEKQADRHTAQPFCESHYIIEDGSIAEEREADGPTCSLRSPRPHKNRSPGA